MTKSALLTARSAVWLDGAGAAVHGDPLPFAQSGGGVAGGDHGGDAVLAGDQGGVGGQGAAVGDDRDGAGEQWRPGRGGGPGDQDLAGLEAVEVAGPWMMRTGPVARPGLAGCPTMAPSATAAGVRTASTVASSSLTISRGGRPMVKGASKRRCRSQIPRRRSTS